MSQSLSQRLLQFTGASVVAGSLLFAAPQADAATFTSTDGTFTFSVFTPNGESALPLTVTTSTIRTGIGSSSVTGTRYNFQGTFSGRSLLSGINPFTSTTPQNACPAGEICISGSLYVTSGAYQRQGGSSTGAGSLTQVNAVKLSNFAITNNTANTLLYPNDGEANNLLSFFQSIANGYNIQQFYNSLTGKVVQVPSSFGVYATTYPTLASGSAAYVPININSTNPDGTVSQFVSTIFSADETDFYNQKITGLQGFLYYLSLPAGTSFQLPDSSDDLILSLEDGVTPDLPPGQPLLTQEEVLFLINAFSGLPATPPEGSNFKLFTPGGEEFIADGSGIPNEPEAVPEPSAFLGLIALGGLFSRLRKKNVAQES